MKKPLTEFKEFVMKGNMLDLAVGIIVGGSFGTIVNSLVKDIIMPPIGLLLGNIDFSNMFVQLNPNKVPLDPSIKTVAAAQEAGAVTLNYGLFINALISFLIIALSVFLIVKVVGKLKNAAEKTIKKEAADLPEEPKEKTCPFCISTIPIAATRCPFCTSKLEE